MRPIEDTTSLEHRIEELAAVRTDARLRFFDAEAGRIAALCRVMADRFEAGGTLLAAGLTPQGRSDARHVAVEFVHPVIVGKRALPARALGMGVDAAAADVTLHAGKDDMVVVFGDDGTGTAAELIAAARDAGCLTISFGCPDAEWCFRTGASDALVDQELVEIAYHLAWELVHVFFDHRPLSGAGLAAGESAAGGAAGFLYPFLGSQASGESLLQDVRGSVLAKARETDELSTRTLRESSAQLTRLAHDLRRRFDAGGRLLAFGNGGSSTDAADLVADFQDACVGGVPRPAIDLSEDPAILTALTNDVGAECIFARQVIAHGRPGDVAFALSTSGSSRNILDALAEARRRGITTVALLGYDGGRIAAEGLADHVIVARSEHVPRIQEAHAAACHVLRDLVERVAEPAR